MSHAEIESSGVNGKSLENGEKKAPFGTFKSGAPRIHLTRSTYADPLWFPLLFLSHTTFSFLYIAAKEHMCAQ